MTEQATTDTPGAEATPAVSVLVPIYNVERYLAECLDSLVAQTFTDFEVLCINDGSTDGSRDIIERYLQADARFRVVDKPNSGYGASMNRGLAEARGDYIAILESDDFMEPNALATLHGAMVEHDVDVAKANFWLYWSTPKEVDELYEGFEPRECGRVVDPTDYTKIFHVKPSIWSAMYRKAFLDEHGIRFLETPGASFQDLSFTFKVWASTRRIVLLFEPLVHYRQDNENSSVNSMGKVNAVFDEYAEIGRWLEDHPDQRERFAAVKSAMMYDSCIWNYERVGADNKLNLLSMTRDAFLAEQASGGLDIREFEPWKLLGLRNILISPARFHADHARQQSLPARAARIAWTASPKDLMWAVRRRVVSKLR